MAATPCVLRYLSSQYATGQGQATVDNMPGAVLVSDVAGVLTFTYGGDTFALTDGQWIVWNAVGVCGLMDDADYQVKYAPLA